MTENSAGWFELWDQHSVNLVADFDTLQELVDFAYELGQVNPDQPSGLSVVHRTTDDKGPKVAARYDKVPA